MNKEDNLRITTILEEMKSADPKVKAEAAKQLNVVALAIGKEKSRNELLPFISGIH
jgi:hypothetical protein